MKIETGGEVKEVLINEDIFHPEAESVSICFRGKNSSGIVDFSPKELESILESVKSRMHLVKGLQRLRGRL